MAAPAPKSARKQLRGHERATAEPAAPSPAPAPSPSAERLPAGVPSIYADQVMDVVYGLNTSKVVFGIETGIGSLRPVAIAVVPTSALLATAVGIVRDLTSQAIREETATRFKSYLGYMEEVSQPTKA
jgi:hypothetical protein